MFHKILIANRGEIALRVIRTARRMNVRTVAVYSEADRDSLHVIEADEAVFIGAAAPSESYLRADRIIAAAKATGAEAIHPGYGFLSENADFVDACAAAGLVFIGPPASAMRAMGDKASSKQAMRRAGTPLAPGYDGADQSPALLLKEAKRIGWPVMIKASAGGGGKGMRVVRGADEFQEALESCQREAKSSFGDARVLIEKLIEDPRHVEVQVFGDSHGTVVHLFTRDCSAQRRRQKVIEEAPAPFLDPKIADAMHKAAVNAAAAVGYQGAGTVEFLVGSDGGFYFMEMNARLQVEHPVTEYITGLDLVEWQLRAASGEPLPLRQDEITARGHAVEARLYAEDADGGFLPAPGPVKHLRFPENTTHVRIDSGVRDGDDVTPWYDPMIAKVIAWDENRDRAFDRLHGALGATEALGLTTNRDFLMRLINLREMRRGPLDTGLIERNRADLFPAAAPAPLEALAAAALEGVLLAPTGDDPWDSRDGWRMGGAAARIVTLRDREAVRRVSVRPQAGGFLISEGGASAKAVAARTGDALTLTLDERRVTARVVTLGDHREVFLEGARWRLEVIDPLAHAGETEDEAGGLRAPMPGKVVKLFAAPGATVSRGTPLLAVEAMKMEHTILAPADGVFKPLVKPGDQVAEGENLAEIAS